MGIFVGFDEIVIIIKRNDRLLVNGSAHILQMFLGLLSPHLNLIFFHPIYKLHHL